MANNHLELYTDYLTVSFSQATATGLSAMLDGDISHDQITRFLSGHNFTSKDLWRYVKSTVRKVEEENAVLVFDDCIQEKQWTDENDIMCWHYDHCAGRSVRGINLLNCLYYSGGVSIPVAFEIVHKPIPYCDVKTRREKRRAEVTKNEHMLRMVDVAIHNQLKFQYVLMDSWFSSSGNMTHIRTKKGKHFICAIKTNRLVALSDEDKKNRRFTRIDALEWPEDGTVKGWLKGVKFPVMLTRKVFKNKNGSTGTLYLACSDLKLDGAEIWAIYKKRWKVEEFHKSLKQNAALAKSPTRRVRTQSNHIFASIVAVFKLELLKMKQQLNHFALRGKLYIKAITTAYQQLQKLKFA
jgi:IS4 transposase